MIRIHLYPAGSPDGPPIELACNAGQSVMQAAVAASIEGIEADCGGMMTCATCHVYVREPHASRLAPPSEEERGMLEFTAAERKPNSRLSCQIVLDESLDGLAADLPDTQH